MNNIKDLRNLHKENKPETVVANKPKRKKGFKIAIIAGILALIVLTIVTFFVMRNKLYDDNKYNFSFIHPRNWQQEDLAKDGLDKYIAVKLNDTKTGSVFQVRIESKDDVKFDAQELIKELDIKMKQELENFEKISAKEISVSGRNSLEYLYKYQSKADNGETKNIEQKMVISVDGSKIYYLIFQTPASNYSKQEKTFDAVLKSFKIK